MNRLGLLVMAYGGPDCLDDVDPYLQDIRGGRPTPTGLVEEIRERYRRIGGKSPLRGITEAQAAALQQELRKRGMLVTIAVGMRHWQPRISTAVERLAEEGVTAVVGLAMVPHYSRRSVGVYEEQVRAAVARLSPAMNLGFVSHFGDHPRFVTAVARDLTSVCDSLTGTTPARVLFSAHSLPTEWVSGGDPYPEQVSTSAEAVAGWAGLTQSQWRLCYQSAGARPGAWLGPSLEDEVRRAADDNVHEVIVVPFGFVADHVEILFDIDIELYELGASLGVTVTRTPSLGTSQELIAVLADRVQDASASI